MYANPYSQRPYPDYCRGIYIKVDIMVIMKTILVDAVDTFVVNGKINDAMHEMLEEFKEPKVIVTNADDSQLEEFGLIDLPYELFTLKHQPDKDKIEYFETLLKQYNLQPDEVVYFEHNPDAVRSAEENGISSYLYDPDKKDLAALKEFLITNI